jgi:hypothetical protein
MNGAEIVHQRQLLDQIVGVEHRERSVADQQVAALRRPVNMYLLVTGYTDPP